VSHPSFRRTRRVSAIATFAVIALALQAAPGGAQEGALTPGRGQAIARAYKVNPKAAGLSLGISLGLSLAGHQNTASTAESRAVDLGIIGTLMAAEGCDGGDPTLPAESQPQPLSVSSRDEGAAEGKTAEEDTPPGVGTKRALARQDPYAEAETTILPFEIPGALAVSGGRSLTSSGVVEGVRQALAVAEIGRISFAGGAVELGGLRWVARHRTGGEELVEGSFSIGSAAIAGTPIPTEGRDPAAVLEQVNTALAPLGLVVTPPTARSASGIQFVDPISIGIVPSPERDGITSSLLGPAQPVREQLFQAIIDQDCSNDTYITVADVVLGALTGAGSLTLELGGVQASTSDIAFSSRLGGLGQGSLGAVPSSSSGGSSLGSISSSTPVVPSSGGTGTATTPEVATSGGDTPLATTPASSTSDGARGGAMAAVALGGLALVALTAEADRRRMRRAIRTIPVEA
jgi:hypothetical protein